jgi:hypothetical protein
LASIAVSSALRESLLLFSFWVSARNSVMAFSVRVELKEASQNTRLFSREIAMQSFGGDN